MQRPWQPPAALDAIDLQLLSALSKNARIAMKDLAALVGLSPPSTADRVRRLEDVGIITGYTVTLDHEQLGLPLSVFIRIRPLPGKLPAVVEMLAARPEIVACDRVTGDDCLVARAVLPSVAYLEALIDTLLPVATTTTSLIQSSPVGARIPDFTALHGARQHQKSGTARRESI